MRNDLIQILLIDPDRLFAPKILKVLKEAGYNISLAETERSAFHLTRKSLPNLVIKSQAGSTGKSNRLMEKMREHVCPDIQFIFISPQKDVHMAMEAIHRGAFDCLPWPCEESLLMESIRRALEHQSLAAEHPEIRRRLKRRSQPNIFVGTSSSMESIQETIEQVADTDVTVLIEGESGTGKELVARTLHDLGSRQSGPFIAVNCAALPDSIIESELFGHVRGAFTGAVNDKPGRFELARGGTLFLDEIGDLSQLGQADLLRVLEDGIFRPLGSRNIVQANARVVAATNRQLEKLCAQGKFREDLLYRLNVITITLPPLRERTEDIPDLAGMFIQHFCAKHRRPVKKLSPDLARRLQGLPWPGNVRQLRNVIERMVLITPSRTLLLEHLPSHLPPEKNSQTDSPETSFHGMSLREVEEECIRLTLARNGGNRTEAARQLGISRRALHYKLKQGQNKTLPETPISISKSDH